MLYDIVVWLNYVTGDYDYRITFCSYNSFSVEIKLFQFNSAEQIREEFGLVELFWLLLRLGLLPKLFLALYTTYYHRQRSRFR